MIFLEIARLSPESLAAVAELDQRCLGGIWSLENYRREMESPNSDLLVLSILPGTSETANNSSSCDLLIGVGCLWSILEEAHITLLAIDPKYQGKGLGQVMLYQLLVCAWQRHLEWATLEVRASNQRAINLYRKFGFQDVGRRRRYYQDNGEDALILWHHGIARPSFETCLAEWKQLVCDRLANSGFRFPSLEFSES